MASALNMPDLASQILDQEHRNRQALALLLDQQLGKRNRLLVTKTRMGGTEAYLGSVTLQWLSERVSFASELPLFHNGIDPVTGNESLIELIEQRPLDWRRQAALAQYLASRKIHKFPPVLVVVSRSWVDNPQADEWSRDGQAVRAVTDVLPLDSQGQVGLLDVSDEVQFFALDGQHRLMGVRGLMELINTGRLARKKKNGQPESHPPILIESLAEAGGVTRSYIQDLSAESIGVEFIPAVVAGETQQEARRRVRSIFVHVNRTALGEPAQLDEDDGFVIIARRLAVSYPFLRDSRTGMSWKSPSIPERSPYTTTLKTLRDMAEHYLERSPRFQNWQSDERGLVPIRPEDSELEEGYDLFQELWDQITKLPSFTRIQNGEEPARLRSFSKSRKPGEGHMLMRPVGQVALSSALGKLVFEKKKGLNELFPLLQSFDQEGGFRMDNERSPWYMVLYDPSKQRVAIRGEALAARLLVYLLAPETVKGAKAKALRQDFADARTIDLGQHEGEARSLDGVWVAPDQVELPPPISL